MRVRSIRALLYREMIHSILVQIFLIIFFQSSQNSLSQLRPVHSGLNLIQVDCCFQCGQLFAHINNDVITKLMRMKD